VTISIILYAIIGFSIEIIFNALRMFFSSQHKDYALKGSASIWMLPIYGFGLTYGFDFILWLSSIVGMGDVFRWAFYPIWIWLLELIIGIPTKNKLWDYSDISYNWKGVISFKHYPAWLVFGIFIENLRLYTDSILL
jgi:uncharacterized membrane protein